MKLFKIYCTYFIYFLVLNSNLNLNYSTDINTFIKIRSICTKDTPLSWLHASYVGLLTTVNLKEVKNNVYFEFQDVKSGNITKTKDYVLWNYSLLYSDYIDNVNKKLKPT